MKATFIFLILISSFISVFCQEYRLEYANSYGNDGQNLGYDIKVDNYGNAYVTGSFVGILELGGVTLIAQGYSDLFIAKYNKNGGLEWAHQVGGATGYEDQGRSICIDNEGSCYLTGSFIGTASFNDTTLIAFDNSSDVFLIKYDPSGNRQWLKQIGGKGIDNGNKVIYDPNNNLYLLGTFGSDTIFCNEETRIYNNTYGALALFKYDALGNLIDANIIAKYVVDQAKNWGLIVDDFGNLYISGTFTYSEIKGQLLTSTGLRDIFMFKQDNEGKLIWLNQIGGKGDDYCNSMCYDGKNNLYITGQFQDSVYFGDHLILSSNLVNFDGLTDIYVAKIDTAGEVKWVTKGGDMNNDQAFDMDISSQNEIYVIGRFEDSLIYNNQNIVSNGLYDIYISKFDSLGNHIYSNAYGGNSESLSHDNGYGIDLDLYDNLYITGSYNGTIDLITNTITSTGQDDIYIIRWNKCITDTTVDIEACESYTSPSGHVWTSSGVYKDTISNSYGCDSIITINLTIEEIDNSVIQSGGVLTAVENNATYQWLSCITGFNIEGETNQNYSPIVSGIYAVRVSKGICEVLSPCYTVEITSLDENSMRQVQIYPNPVSDYLKVNLGEEFKSIDCKIIDICGRTLFHRQFSDQSILSLDIRKLRVGLYFLIVRFDSREAIFKININ